jgi:hypothetical protein
MSCFIALSSAHCFSGALGKKILYRSAEIFHYGGPTSLPCGRLSPDPLSSIADSAELPGQLSPHRSNISIPKTVHYDRKICHRPWRPCIEDILKKAIFPLNSLLLHRTISDNEATVWDNSLRFS